MKRLFKIITVLVLALGIAGCGNKLPLPKGEGSTEGPIATIVVKDYGTMQFQLFNDVPNTVNNFVTLANQGYYNGLTFHRLIKDFMIQGGDPDGNGTGGPGYTIAGEFNKNKILNTHKHHKGAIAMARGTDKNSAGSQFYIVFNEESCKTLEGDYAVFGQLISGAKVLDKLNNAPLQVANPETGAVSEQPEPQIIIESITIDTKGVEYPEPEKLAK